VSRTNVPAPPWHVQRRDEAASTKDPAALWASSCVPFRQTARAHPKRKRDSLPGSNRHSVERSRLQCGTMQMPRPVPSPRLCRVIRQCATKS
jgi:hypothetical protein